MKLHLLLLFFTLLFSVQVFSQDENYPQKKTHTYLYTFENATSQQQLDELVVEIESLKGVVGVKINCKWESGRGQLIFVIEEIITGDENKNDFEMVRVKQAIIDNKLSPVELIIKN